MHIVRFVVKDHLPRESCCEGSPTYMNYFVCLNISFYRSSPGIFCFLSGTELICWCMSGRRFVRLACEADLHRRLTISPLRMRRAFCIGLQESVQSKPDMTMWFHAIDSPRRWRSMAPLDHAFHEAALSSLHQTEDLVRKLTSWIHGMTRLFRQLRCQSISLEVTQDTYTSSSTWRAAIFTKVRNSRMAFMTQSA
jgi:hypothetical protein